MVGKQSIEFIRQKNVPILQEMTIPTADRNMNSSDFAGRSEEVPIENYL